jgi:PKD repeat protein
MRTIYIAGIVVIAFLLMAIPVGATVSTSTFTPKMTSAVDTGGNITQTSSELGGIYSAYKMFDYANGSVDNPWISNGVKDAWTKLIMPSSHQLGAYELHLFAATSNAPRSWTIEGSNDNVTWTVLDKQTDFATPGVWTNLQYKFNIAANANTTPSYKNWMLHVSDSWTGDVEIVELYLFEVTPSAPVAAFTAINVSTATNGTSQVWQGKSPFTMQFTDTSVPTAISHVWNFTNTTGDNAPHTFNTSTFSAPIYTFKDVGNFSVQLNATNAYGTNISPQLTYFVNVTAPVHLLSRFDPVAGANGTAPLYVQFFDNSTWL